MQLFSRNKALAALSLGALAALGACGDDVTVPAPVNPPVAVTISPSNANVAVGGSLTLAVSVSGGTTTPDYACSVTPAAGVITVAKVAGGCSVTGVAPGNATVIATAGTASAAAAITVQAPAPAISGIAISPAAQNLQVGGTVTISANPTTTAPGATVAKNFVSSNNAVATVNATSGVVTAVAPGTATITVTLTGTGTGLTQAVVTGQVAITVTANPPSVTGVSVTPASAAMIVGGAPVTGTATATAATGITPTFSAGSSNPGVATAAVTSAGAFTITAVGPGQAVITITAQSAGNASFSAASATAQIPVTVNAAPQVSIANITQSQSNDPVDISNVYGQIQVALNLTTNNNVVSGVRLYVCDNGVDCTTTAQPAAQQLFGTAGASNGQINLFINTADFLVASDWASATTRFKNGQKNLIAVLNVGTPSNANSNLAILNFNNTDTFAARHIAPTRAVVAGATSPNANLTYYGGPGAEGRGSATFVPVFYTAGRSVTTAIADLTGSACSGTDFTFTGAGPWTITYGKSGTADTVNTVTKFDACSGLSNGLDLGIRVLSAIDNAQNNVGGLSTTSFATNSSNSPAVTAPAVIRADYQNPNASYSLPIQVAGALAGWVNASYNFAATGNTAGSNDGNGVGLVAVPTIQVQGCPYVSTSASKVWVTLTTNTGADVAECASDLSGGPALTGPYEARYTAIDLLGNSTTTSATPRFGVDKTNPLIRYAARTAPADTIYGTSAATDTLFLAEVLDERAGFDDATAATHFITRANRFQRNGSNVSSFATCIVGTTPSAGVGALFVTAPTCTGATVGSLGTVDGTTGYRSIAAVTPAVLEGIAAGTWREGYYTYRATITDRAGNRSTSAYRRVARNVRTPFSVVADLPLFPITSTFAGSFTGTFKDSLETNLTSLAMVYGAGDTLTFPAATAGATTFDDVITRDSTFSRSLPFTSGTRFYTDLEQVAAGGLIAGSTSTSPDSVGFWAQNFGGNGAFSFQSFVSGSITADATGWATKNANLISFAVVPTDAGFNAPAGGLIKARATGNVNLLNSPFARVDYYREAAAGRWEYIGSVDASSTPCISESQAGCSVYVADNGTNRYFTYVLRSTVNGARSLSNTFGAVGATNYRAIATTGTAGRALSSLPSSYTVAPPTIRSR